MVTCKQDLLKYAVYTKVSIKKSHESVHKFQSLKARDFKEVSPTPCITNIDSLINVAQHQALNTNLVLRKIYNRQVQGITTEYMKRGSKVPTH